MSRRVELVLADWPQPCNGGCGRLLRPPKAKAKDYPNRRTCASQRVLEPWCQVCTGKIKGKKGGHHKEPVTPLSEAEEERRIEAIRADLRRMVADRRRRGIPPEGVVLPGDQKMHVRLQRALPGEKLKPARRTPKLAETQAEDAPMGRCSRGHPFTDLDPVGRRRCETCAAIRLAENAKRRIEREGGVVPAFGSKTCRRGHEYTHVSGNRKYCPTCKAASRKRVAMAKAMMQHASA